MVIDKPWGYFRTTLFKACIESMGVGGNYCPYITGERKYWADHERLLEVCLPVLPLRWMPSETGTVPPKDLCNLICQLI